MTVTKIREALELLEKQGFGDCGLILRTRGQTIDDGNYAESIEIVGLTPVITAEPHFGQPESEN